MTDDLVQSSNAGRLTVLEGRLDRMTQENALLRQRVQALEGTTRARHDSPSIADNMRAASSPAAPSPDPARNPGAFG